MHFLLRNSPLKCFPIYFDIWNRIIICVTAVDALLSGSDCFTAAGAGVKLAARAAETAGVEAVYYLTG